MILRKLILNIELSSYIEKENYFFSENIYLITTEGFAKNVIAHAIARTDSRQQSHHSLTIWRIKKTEFSYLTRCCLQLRKQELCVQDYPMPVKQPIENYKLLRQDLKAFLKDIKKTTVPPGGGGYWYCHIWAI